MTEGRAHFLIRPWSLTEVGVDLTTLGVNESVFALANGHIGMRGTLDDSGTAQCGRKSAAETINLRPIR